MEGVDVNGLPQEAVGGGGGREGAGKPRKIWHFQVFKWAQLEWTDA